MTSFLKTLQLFFIYDTSSLVFKIIIKQKKLYTKFDLIKPNKGKTQLAQNPPSALGRTELKTFRLPFYFSFFHQILFHMFSTPLFLSSLFGLQLILQKSCVFNCLPKFISILYELCLYIFILHQGVPLNTPRGPTPLHPAHLVCALVLLPNLFGSFKENLGQINHHPFLQIQIKQRTIRKRLLWEFNL